MVEQELQSINILSKYNTPFPVAKEISETLEN
jgi:hypothetical protein